MYLFHGIFSYSCSFIMNRDGIPTSNIPAIRNISHAIHTKSNYIHISSTSELTIEFVPSANGNGSQLNVRVLGVPQSPIPDRAGRVATSTASLQIQSASGESGSSNAAKVPNGENRSYDPPSNLHQLNDV